MGIDVTTYGVLPRPIRPHRVIVVGAGVAGLVAAFELTRAGHDVTVLEARMRPGGRIHTIRDGFADGLYAEAGAVDFGDAYTGLLHYIRLLGLPLVRRSDARRMQVLFARNQRYLLPPDPDWPFELSVVERELGWDILWRLHVSSAARQIDDPTSDHWPGPDLLILDHCTLNDRLRKRGLSDAAISMFRLSLDGPDYDHLSALQSLSLEWFVAQNSRWMSIRGGNDRLPLALAQRLGPRIRYGTVLVKVEQSNREVRTTCLHAGLWEQLRADRVIIAIPFSTLRRVELDSSFSPEKRKAIANLRYEAILRVYLQTRTRFWARRGEQGFAATDLPIASVLEHTWGQHGTRGILEAQMSHNEARFARALQPEQRIRWTVEHMERVHPGLTRDFEGGASVCWDDEPWSLGGWAYYGPGEMTALFPHAARPEGRVHFAGEHTSGLGRTLEGAVQSGIRTAREVNSAA